MIKVPCKDCKDRCAQCRSFCADWKKYEEMKKEEYESRRLNAASTPEPSKYAQRMFKNASKK